MSLEKHRRARPSPQDRISPNLGTQNTPPPITSQTENDNQPLTMVRKGQLVPGDLVKVVGGKHRGEIAKFVDCCHTGRGIKGVFSVMGDHSKSEARIEYRLVEQEIQDSLKNEKAEKEEALRSLLLEARSLQIQMANLVKKIEALSV
jgi:hypothetical protein